MIATMTRPKKITSSGMVILNISSTQTLTGVLRVYIDDKLAEID